MRIIKLDRGCETIVDDDDYKILSQFNWYINHDGYVYKGKYTRGTKKTSSTRMHRMIMSAPDKMDVDHINHNRLDNRRENLRICTRSANTMNRDKFPTRNTSGFKGVSWSKFHRKWDARIKKDGKNYWLGLFTNKEDANLAYQRKARELFKEFNYFR